MLIISVNELLEICSYGIGQKLAQELGKHYARYNDYSRIKDLIIVELVRRNGELCTCQKQRRELYRKLEDSDQVDLFLKPNKMR